MKKTDELTRMADRLKEAAVSPRIYNRDSLKHCFILAKKYHSPVIIRVPVEEYDLQEIADLAHYFEKDFEHAEISLMAEGITTYEEAVKAGAAGYDGIAVADSLDITGKENMEQIRQLARVARAFNMSIQVSAKDVEHLTEGAGYQLVKRGHVDMLKLMIGEELHEDPEKYKEIIHILRKETLATLGFGEDTYVKPEEMREFAEKGISKFDVYKDYDKACVKKVKERYENGPLTYRKLFMLDLQAELNQAFEENVDYLIHRAGHFVKR